ncbi:hypothetical protein T265_08291 [Opisthorchis viverrini]|uniref:Uncharacterized protein n=1 Tax=Opisthorchis viverrini TaxID=6198 RepID=A0A074ZE48_OPIVI|nr:hypothetical protein T265_08291 [Opisthorchis viverrini]KER23927.1 hypothetical protein T265_08291 [Opisthorchis viverrini]
MWLQQFILDWHLDLAAISNGRRTESLGSNRLGYPVTLQENKTRGGQFPTAFPADSIRLSMKMNILDPQWSALLTGRNHPTPSETPS